MKGSFEVGSQVLAGKRKKLIAILISGWVLLSGIMISSCTLDPEKNREPPPVVIRVDDIQDFAFKEGQKFLFDEGLQNNIPLSLAVIPGAFGEDQEMVEMLKISRTYQANADMIALQDQTLGKLMSELPKL